MDDNEIVKQLIQGDQDAFRQVVALYQSKVLSTSYRFVMNKEDAEDITQEVFIEVYRSVYRFREEAKLSSWIFTITISKSLDFLRKKKRKKRMGFFLGMLGNEGEAENVAAPSVTEPLHILENKERIRFLQQALDSLPKNQHIAYTLNKIEGINNRKVAEIMNISLSAADALIHRARKNMEKKLYKYYYKIL